MTSIEQSIKDQFAQCFEPRDWALFKDMAEVNLTEAAMIKKSSFGQVAKERRLLVRNARKRLLIGVGTELLLKAVYLKLGFAINRLKKGQPAVPFPYRWAEIETDLLDRDLTFKFDQLINHLTKVQLPFPDVNLVLRGLNIAKVYRNKEGHVVTRNHVFDPESYRAIEASLQGLYATAFAEALTVRFSLEPRESGCWKVSPLTDTSAEQG